MAKITLTITKSEEDTYTVKCGTSVGGGQEKCKGKTLDEVKEFVGGIIERLDGDGFIGRK